MPIAEVAPICPGNHGPGRPRLILHVRAELGHGTPTRRKTVVAHRPNVISGGSICPIGLQNAERLAGDERPDGRVRRRPHCKPCYGSSCYVKELARTLIIGETPASILWPDWTRVCRAARSPARRWWLSRVVGPMDRPDLGCAQYEPRHRAPNLSHFRTLSETPLVKRQHRRR